MCGIPEDFQFAYKLTYALVNMLSQKSRILFIHVTLNV